LAVLHAAAFVLLPVAVFMPLWTTMVAAAAALAMLVVAVGGGVRRLRVTGLVVAALVLALAWAAITAMWAVEPDRAVKTADRLVLFVVVVGLLVSAAAGLPDDERIRFERALVAGGVLGLALMAFELLLAAPISRLLHGDERAGAFGLAFFNRGASVMALMAWPLLLAVWRCLGPAAAAAAFVVIAATVV
ncbi:MAG: hypothetical protein V3U93_06710, partial [Alphaproteobacteria bacterium]